MIEKYHAFCFYLEKVTFIFLVLLLSTMLVVAWAHVFYRYALGSALFWSEELLRFSLVWFALLSASVIFRRKGHLGIVVFVEKMPQYIRRKVACAVLYLFLAVNLVVTWQGFILLGKVYDQLTPALRIPVSIPYASVPVSFLLMLFYCISDILNWYESRN
jgi:TRAP-type C4-dicarboxylate transport system permease small subunit